MGLRSRSSVLAAPAAPAFDPAAYWTERHAAHAGLLAAVGHRCLTEQENAAQYEIKRRRIVEVLGRYLPDPRGRALLDAGCGTGVLSETFSTLGYIVTGVDFCESAVHAARERVRDAEFLVSPLDELCLGDRFDAITAVDVFIHIVDDDNWRRTLSNLAGHLKPGGVLLILDSMSVDGQRDATHCCRRSREQWQRLFTVLNLDADYDDCFELAHEGSRKDLFVLRSTAVSP
jgi:SAM-dependent methyltransferase